MMMSSSRGTTISRPPHGETARARLDFFLFDGQRQFHFLFRSGLFLGRSLKT